MFWKPTFKWKDYRRKGDDRYSTLTLDCHEFIPVSYTHLTLPTIYSV